MEFEVEHPFTRTDFCDILSLAEDHVIFHTGASIDYVQLDGSVERDIKRWQIPEVTGIGNPDACTTSVGSIAIRFVDGIHNKVVFK